MNGSAVAAYGRVEFEGTFHSGILRLLCAISSQMVRNVEMNVMEVLVPRKPRNTNGKLSSAEDLRAVIRKRRKALGLTQVELAETCKCSPRFIGELERGIAGGNIKQVIHVCSMLGIDLFAKVRGE